METIQAQVSQRLLSKATRLFSGTLSGRIIEILQNARRAGATTVHITNLDGSVAVCDNGHGIEDFAKLLDLGNSGWDQGTEEAEDPAGVGVFCLAPREVEIHSGHKNVVITEKAWTGEPVPVQTIDGFFLGTKLQFTDEPWTFDEVEKQAVFSGLNVTVDDKPCSHRWSMSLRHSVYQSATKPLPMATMAITRVGPKKSFWRHMRPTYFFMNLLMPRITALKDSYRGDKYPVRRLSQN